jgi:integrase
MYNIYKFRGEKQINWLLHNTLLKPNRKLPFSDNFLKQYTNYISMARYDDIIPYDKLKEFFNECPEPYWKRIAQGLYYTGCRAGELIKIQNQHITIDKDNPDFLSIKIFTEKNPHSPVRYIPINTKKEPQAMEVFPINPNSLDYSFPSYNPTILPESYLRVMRKKLNEFFPGFAPHYFRHCRLTHMITEFDFNDYELVKYAGWSDSKPAKWYVSLKTTDLQKKMI